MEKKETGFHALHLHFNNRLYDISGGNDGLFTLARVLVRKKTKENPSMPDCVTAVTHNSSLVKK